MYSEGQKKAKVGIVSVDIHGNSYRLRFVYPKGSRHQFTIAKATPEGWTTAIKAAQLINRDIDLGDFDESYVRYSPKHASVIQLANKKAQKEYNLKDLWNEYKKSSEKRVAKTTKRNLWKVTDRLMDRCEPKLLSLNKAVEFINFALEEYAVSTMSTLFRTCINPCVNLGVKTKKIAENPYNSITLPKQQKKKNECFESHEIRAIIEAFYSDEYVSKKSRYKDSYYASMVEFLALTGCRPEECHALTWEDIKHKKGRTFIRFNKAYSKGILLNHTKTHTIRLFPCNKQLLNLIKSIVKTHNANNLIFPAINNGYMNHDNFRERYWNKIVNALVEQQLVSKRLKPYCLRHSFITRLIREGVDIATVASLSGNSPEIIIKNYLASREDFDLPEL